MKDRTPRKKSTETELLLYLTGRVSISYDAILMLTANSNYTEILMKDGTTYMSSTTLGVLEKRLAGFNFFRLNRSVLINLNYLEDFSINATKNVLVKLKQNDQEFQVSRRRKPMLIKALISTNN
jgi:DNA-binding LytR/AlgR family response regulator